MSTLTLPEGIIELDGGRRLVPDLRRYQGVPPGVLVFREHDRKGGGLLVLAGLERYMDGKYGPLLHVSFSYPDRLPTWNDVKKVKAAFFGPDVDAMVLLPREANYVNDHNFTHHLWQLPEPWTDEGPLR